MKHPNYQFSISWIRLIVITIAALYVNKVGGMPSLESMMLYAVFLFVMGHFEPQSESKK